MADIRDQCLRLIVEPFLIAKEQENDHHRCSDEVVVKVMSQNAELNQAVHDEIHRCLLVVYPLGFRGVKAGERL
jgi:hypothetical protein